MKSAGEGMRKDERKRCENLVKDRFYGLNRGMCCVYERMQNQIPICLKFIQLGDGRELRNRRR